MGKLRLKEMKILGGEFYPQMELTGRENSLQTGRWTLILAMVLIGAGLICTNAQAVKETSRSAVAAPAAQKQPYALYLEILGKGGVWGVGGDLQLGERWAIGTTGSFQSWGTQTVLSVSPYVTRYLFPERRHRPFFQAGPQWVYLSTSSLVPEWKGSRASGLGIQLSAGYEYRNIFLFRFFAMGSIGRQGVAPWMGFDIGHAF